MIGKQEAARQIQRKLWLSGSTIHNPGPSSVPPSLPPPPPTSTTLLGTGVGSMSTALIIANASTNLLSSEDTSQSVAAFTTAMGAVANRGKTTVTEALGYPSQSQRLPGNISIPDEPFSTKLPPMPALQREPSVNTTMQQDPTLSDDGSGSGVSFSTGVVPANVSGGGTGKSWVGGSISTPTQSDYFHHNKDGKPRIVLPKMPPFFQGLEAFGTVGQLQPALNSISNSNRKRLKSDGVLPAAIGRSQSIDVSSVTGCASSVAVGITPEEQEQTVQAFETLCSSLLPNSFIYLDGAPKLLSLRPVQLQGVLRPLKLPFADKKIGNDAKNSASTSALFYDPFAAKRAKDAVVEVEVLWSIGNISYIEAIFQNPFSCPLRLSNLIVLTEGVVCVANPVTVILPPNRIHSVLLQTQPMLTGKLVICGIRYYVNNAVHESYVTETGLSLTSTAEIPEPWVYPRRAVNVEGKKTKAASSNDQRTGTGYTNTGTNIVRRMDCSSTALSIGEWTNHVMVTPPGAALRVTPTWSSAAGLELFQGEVRYEVLAIENLTALVVDDVRLTVKASGTSVTLGRGGGTDDDAYLLVDFQSANKSALESSNTNRNNNNNNNNNNNGSIGWDPIGVTFSLYPRTGFTLELPLTTGNIQQLPIQASWISQQTVANVGDKADGEVKTVCFDIDSIVRHEDTDSTKTPTIQTEESKRQEIENVQRYYRRTSIICRVQTKTAVRIVSMSVRPIINESNETDKSMKGHICDKNDMEYNISDLENYLRNHTVSKKSRIDYHPKISIISPEYFLIIKLANNTVFDTIVSSSKDVLQLRESLKFDETFLELKSKFIRNEKFIIGNDSGSGEDWNVCVPPKSNRLLIKRLSRKEAMQLYTNSNDTKCNVSKEIIQNNNNNTIDMLPPLIWVLNHGSGLRCGALTYPVDTWLSSHTSSNSHHTNTPLLFPEFEYSVEVGGALIEKTRKENTQSSHTNIRVQVDTFYPISIRIRRIKEVPMEDIHRRNRNIQVEVLLAIFDDVKDMQNTENINIDSNANVPSPLARQRKISDGDSIVYRNSKDAIIKGHNKKIISFPYMMSSKSNGNNNDNIMSQSEVIKMSEDGSNSWDSSQIDCVDDQVQQHRVEVLLTRCKTYIVHVFLRTISSDENNAGNASSSVDRWWMNSSPICIHASFS